MKVFHMFSVLSDFVKYISPKKILYDFQVTTVSTIIDLQIFADCVYVS